MPENSSENPPIRRYRHTVVISLALILALAGGVAVFIQQPNTAPLSYEKPAPGIAYVEHAQAKLPIVTYSITRADGKVMPFAVEQATTLEQQEKGLMLRESMEANEGMIFLYPDVQIRQMWMKNTILPLDILFMDAHGTIIDIAANTEPFSEAIITSAQAAQNVLELRAGVTEAYGIKIGDKLSPEKPHATAEE